MIIGLVCFEMYARVYIQDGCMHALYGHCVRSGRVGVMACPNVNLGAPCFRVIILIGEGGESPRAAWAAL